MCRLLDEQRMILNMQAGRLSSLTLEALDGYRERNEPLLQLCQELSECDAQKRSSEGTRGTMPHAGL